MNHDQLLISLPVNLNINILFPANGKVRKDKRANLIACAYYILHAIYTMSLSRKWRDYYDTHGGYPIQSMILEKLFGKNYLTAIKVLVEANVLTRSKGYIAGKQSKLYALTENYLNVGTMVLEFPSDSTAYKKIKPFIILKTEQNRQELDKIAYILKWFDYNRLKIDPKKAHFFIEYYRSEMMKHIPEKLPKNRTQGEINSRLNLRANNMIDTMTCLMRGEMHLKKTGKDHRLHSIISSTKKELRTLYTMDGKPLVSIDLKSSQPYFLSYLFNPEFWSVFGEKLYPELWRLMSRGRDRCTLSSILMFVTSSETQPSKGFQELEFYKFHWKEDFYQHLITLAASVGQHSIFPDRQSVKKKMMQILYNNKQYIELDPAFKLFADWFPREAALLRYFKRLSRNQKQKTGTVNNFLPILLQRIESKMMLEVVCKEISEKYPAAPILPIHDCILTTPEYQDAVLSIIETTLNKIIGIMPGITVETYDQDKILTGLSSLAKNDVIEVLKSPPKGLINETGLKKPILNEIPEYKSLQVLSTRYVFDVEEDEPEDI